MMQSIKNLPATLCTEHRQFFDLQNNLVDECWLLFEEGILLNAYSTLQQAHEEAFKHWQGLGVTKYNYMGERV